MPYSVNREKKIVFSRYSNEFRIEFEPMTWVLLDFRRMEMFSLQSHQIKKTGWWEGNCLIYEYIFWASDCDYQNQKKSFMRNVGPHTRTGEFVPVFPKLIHFFVISVAVVDCGWFNSSFQFHFWHSHGSFFTIAFSGSWTILRLTLTKQERKKTSSHKKWNWKSTKK